MDITIFSEIESKFQERLSLCEQYLGMITEDNPIENISVKQALEARDFCVAELVVQTQILMVDLYHIIGMGNLSAMQMSKLTRWVRTYADYRPDIKAISKWDGNISTLPKIPKRTSFKLLNFDITLVNGRGGDVEEEHETVDDYNAITRAAEPAESTDTKLISEPADESEVEAEHELCPHAVYRLADKTIEIEKGYSLQVANWLVENIMHFKDHKASAIAAAMSSNKAKYGFFWQKMSNGKVLGTIVSTATNLIPICLDNFKNV